jgi:hypothetical protein
VLCLLHLATIEGIHSSPTLLDLRSRIAAILSGHTFGLPLTGLLYAWATLAAGFLTARALTQLATEEALEGPLSQGASIVAGVIVSLFGLGALIGYVTGSTSLFG